MAEPDWQRARYLAEIFGEVLPASTSDDRNVSTERGTDTWHGGGADRGSDDWYQLNRPPHHG